MKFLSLSLLSSRSFLAMPSKVDRKFSTSLASAERSRCWDWNFRSWACGSVVAGDESVPDPELPFISLLIWSCIFPIEGCETI